VSCGQEPQETIVAIVRRNHFRLQKRLNFERIPLTAEVTVCVHGGSAIFERSYPPSVSSVRSATRSGFRTEGVRK